MRVLHVVKTSDGAAWAAAAAAELVALGVEVHAAIPSPEGRMVRQWRESGAVLHFVPADISPRAPWAIPGTLRALRRLVADVRPDLIHSHFVSSTILLRLALGSQSGIPRLFQVPGPLHLEHSLYRNLELRTAGADDVWVASSRCIRDLYRGAGVADHRLYLSYYGMRAESCAGVRPGLLRQRYGIPPMARIVGNANYIYAPKRYLGQKTGLKAHEDVIDALGEVIRQRSDVVGVLIGGSFLQSRAYEMELRARAKAAGGDRILMTGYVPMDEIQQMWPDFDLAVHVPLSENCGGVIEPMLAGVPTIAGRVGGLPEVVIDGMTGTTVPIRQPRALAAEILRALDASDERAEQGRLGRRLVAEMFAVRRTAREIFEIYRHVLGERSTPPEQFDARQFLASQDTCCGVCPKAQ
jgi:glycosyltransferase involved in cell wall biosynthesis